MVRPLKKKKKKKCSFLWSSADLPMIQGLVSWAWAGFQLLCPLGWASVQCTHFYIVWRGSQARRLENTVNLLWEGGSQLISVSTENRGAVFWWFPGILTPNHWSKSLICKWHYILYTACEIISNPNIRKEEWGNIITHALCLFGVLLSSYSYLPPASFSQLDHTSISLVRVRRICMYRVSCVHRRPRGQQLGFGGWNLRSSYSPLQKACLPSSALIWYNPPGGMHTFICFHFVLLAFINICLGFVVVVKGV